jgi:hypothetical protein
MAVANELKYDQYKIKQMESSKLDSLDRVIEEGILNDIVQYNFIIFVYLVSWPLKDILHQPRMKGKHYVE